MNRRIRWTVACLLAGFWAVSFLPAQGQSTTTISLPQPTGPFGVGTVVWDWPDPGRLDEISPYPNDVREIMAQAWYPADGPATAPTGVYAPLERDLSNVTGWSKPGVPFTAQLEKAPLIALCPGSRTPRYFYTSVAEDLASHGYVVLGVDFPYVGFVIYPDGRTISNAFPIPSGPYEVVDQFLETPGNLEIGDLQFALTSLERISDDDPARRLTGRIDWRHLGAFGHSLGSRGCGGVAADDHRFDAIASMEGAFPFAVRERGPKIPVLLMFGVGLPQYVRDAIRQLIPNRRDDLYDLTLPSFLHNNVDELPLVYPMQFPSLINPYVGLAETRDVLLTFFDQFVRGTGPGISSVPSRIPGATLLFYPGPGHGDGHDQ